jgi:hypothetical protein
MCIGIFIRLAGERIGLHHVDQCRLSSKIPSTTAVVGPVGTLVLDGAENSRIVLSAIGADKVLSTGSTVFIS